MIVSAYCPNLSPHAHFKCKDSGRIIDLPIDKETLNTLKIFYPKDFHMPDLIILLRHFTLKQLNYNFVSTLTVQNLSVNIEENLS